MGRTIVEVDEILAEITVKALTAYRHMVSAVHDGDAVTTSVNEAELEVLIVGYALPGKTRMQTFREVLARPHPSETANMMSTTGLRRTRMYRV